jgi:hypothetical protein
LAFAQLAEQKLFKKAPVTASLSVAIQGIAKLKQVLSKARVGKGDEKKLATEIDEIQKNLQEFADLMTVALKSRLKLTFAECELFKTMGDAHKDASNKSQALGESLGKLTERVLQLTAISLGHEKRINALDSKSGRPHKQDKAKRKGKRK